MFGNTIYEESSNICAAAMHSGTIDIDGGKFVVALEEPLKEYKGTTANKLLSKDKRSNKALFSNF